MWQNQKAGDNSALIQAGQVNFGLGVEDVEYISKKMAMETFAAYSQDAFNAMKERVEEFAQAYLNQLAMESPDSVKNIKDPGVQAAILDAESAYAKSGDENLGALLVDILTKRTQLLERGVPQIALSEAINVAQKLTTRQHSLLSLVFILRHVVLGAGSIADLHEKWRLCLGPLAREIKLGYQGTTTQHVVATGSAFLLPVSKSVHQTIQETYPSFFAMGIEADHPAVTQFRGSGLFIPCLRDPERVQVAVANEAALERKMDDLDISLDDRQVLKNLLTANPMNGDKIIEELTQVVPEMAPIVKVWDTRNISQLALTSIGIVIAHSNIVRLTQGGFDADLQVFLPED